MDAVELFGEGDLRAFLGSVSSVLPDTALLAVTALPGAHSWFPPVAQPTITAGLARGQVDGNVYVAVSAFDHRPTRGRGGAGSCRWLFGLPVDVDVADDSGAHRSTSKTRLAASTDEALEALLALPVFPSLVWHSGHGVQGLVLLDPPVDVKADPARARALMDGWGRALEDAQQRVGVAFDRVADLARLVRLPGTVNTKVAGDPRPVRLLIGAAGRSWHPDDVEAVLPPVAIRRAHAGCGTRVPDGPPSLFDSDPVTRWTRSLDWAELLTPFGWRLVRERDGVREWRRPGKFGVGASATTGWRPGDVEDGPELLHVFSTSDEHLPAGWYGKPGAYARLLGVDVREVLAAVRSHMRSKPPC